MSEISMIGLDIAKNVFQVHGVDMNGLVVLRRRLRRGQRQLMVSASSRPCRLSRRETA